MKPPKSNLARVLLGFATILPTVTIALLVFGMFGPLEDEVMGSDLFPLLFIGGGGSILLWNIVAFYYMGLVVSSEAKESERQFWLMSLWTFFPITGTIFWWRVIWKQQSVSIATERA